MPFKIIREDITKIKCDAIVNPTNKNLYPGGGVDEAVHKAAGEELLAMCQAIGGLDVGKAKITPAYNLPCKYVIHTVGPWWQGGNQDERKLLQSCYREALKIAVGTKCKSIAFPLISSGLYGYPKDQVLQVALEVIKEFLYENDMLVYLVVFDKTAYALSEQLQCGVTAYIDDNYESFQPQALDGERNEKRIRFSWDRRENRNREDIFMRRETDDYDSDLWEGGFVDKLDDSDGLEKMTQKGFGATVIELLDKKGIDDVECYKRANVSRQTWHKIMSNDEYKPTKRTAVALAISMRLSLEETQSLLETAGFILSKSSLFDVIIMFCISKEIYDVYDVDCILFQYDQETLFSIK